jgi:sugar/nucleoside kinase (ribokinase family)
MAAIGIIGEINLDLIVTGAQRLPHLGEELIVDQMELTLGSSSAITVCQLVRLGNDVLFVSKVGDDQFGRRTLEFLREKGVGTDSVVVDPSLASGLTIAIAVGSERAMLTVLGAIESITYDDVDFGAFSAYDHLHLSSFILQRKLRPDYRRIFERARGMGLTTSLDTGWPQEGDDCADLEDVLEHVDVFLPNEAEAMRFTDTPTVEEALDALAGRVPTVAVKLGPDGAIARRGVEEAGRDAFAVDVVDTTGAGDSFNAGFIHAYLAGSDLEACLDLGNACGALSTRAAGGTTTQPTFEEAQEFIRTAPRRKPGSS